MKIIPTFALAGVSLIALATPAYAQDSSGSSDAAASSGEIIVTARRKEESAQDVPLVVNAVKPLAL